MKKKSIIIIILSIVVVIACFGFVFTKKQKNIAYKQTSQDKAGIRISKRNHANSEKNNQNENDQYSTNEWMLMGYMAYAHDNYVESDHISNTSELVNAVKDDLDNGDSGIKIDIHQVQSSNGVTMDTQDPLANYEQEDN